LKRDALLETQKDAGGFSVKNIVEYLAKTIVY
jgi:hypothetical protein